MTQQELAQLYFDYLEAEGYRPEMEEGFVRFKSDGGTYLIVVDEDDEQYFRMIFPNFWPIESEEERRKVLVAADHATSETKVAKVFTVRDNVWATIEIFCAEPQEFQAIFSRAMRALKAGVRTFLDKMRED